MSPVSQIIGYGYKKTASELETLGASVVYSDRDKGRFEREEMLKRGIREGDVVRVLYIRDLGGSPVADRRIVAMIEGKGATVEEVRPAKRETRGRPAQFKPQSNDGAIWDIWHDAAMTEEQRILKIEREYGLTVKRGALFKRYGSLANPKPRPVAKDGKS